MAGNQTCTVACELLCSIPGSPVPFAVLAAAVFGFFVGKLRSTGSLPTPSLSNGNRNRFGLVPDTNRIPPGDEICHAEPEPQLREHASAVGGEGSAGDGMPAAIEMHASNLERQLQHCHRPWDSGFGPSDPFILLAEISGDDALSLPCKSTSARSSSSSISSLMDLPEKRQVLMSPKTRRPTSSGPRSPRSPRSQTSPCPSFATGGDPNLAAETSGGLRKPTTLQPVSIPRSRTDSESGTPTENVPAIPTETLFEAYENTNYTPRHSETNQESESDDEMLPAAAWMCGADAANKKLECGLSWLNLVQPSLEDVYGQVWMDSVHPDDYRQCKDVIVEALKGRGPFQVQYRLQIKTGLFRWVMDLGKPRFSCNNQRFLGYVGWRVDIEHSKKIEIDYEKYWSLPHEFLIKAGSDGRFFEDVSPFFPRLLGYTKEEFLKLEWMNLLHPDDREYTLNEFKKVAQGQPLVNVINRYRCNPAAEVEGPCFVDVTGKYKWISWTANFLFGAGRDVSTEKQGQLELQRSQEELRRITDAIPGGVFQYRVDDDGVQTFPFISKGAMHMYGSLTEGDGNSSSKSDRGSPTTTELVQELDHYGFHNDGEQNLRLTVHPEDWPKLKEAMRQSSLSGNSLDLDYRLVRGDEVRWVRVHAVPLAREECGQNWCGITWDMTEQHLAEAALRAERDHAEKLNHAKGAFLANMSHEIRTPMNAVIGMGALLLETQLNDEQRDYVSTIRSSGEALLGVINDILDFSKIEAGKMELEVAPFDLGDCIEDSLDLIASQAASKGLDLTYSICETVPTKLRGDAGRLRQILVNLLSNAIKFTSHGSVSIVVDGHCRSSETNDSPETSSSMDANPAASKIMWEIHVAVTDTGIGIPEDRRHALFQPFSQVDASTTRRYGGTGLGLAICARLSALLGGQIWVESNPSHGSAFHFTFVCEAAGRTGEESTHTSLQMKRVLIISGSKSGTQTMVSRFLKSWHALPVLAVTAEEAVSWVHLSCKASKTVSTHSNEEDSELHEPFSVVILDCAMLEAQDPQLLESLKLVKEAVPTIPVILLTPFGRRAQDYAKEHPDLAFDAVVLKPVKASVLLAALMSLLASDSDSGTDSSTREGDQLGTKSGPIKYSKYPTMDSEIGKTCPLRILIAEDNVINQKVLVRLLLRHGYIADVVANGLEALDAASHMRYDVILMDCFMPEMDGLEATRRIRRKVQPCPVIVAVTAAALDDERQACLQAGMHMYIAKPIQAEKLVFVLRKCWQVKDEKLDPDSLQSLGFSPNANRTQ